MATSELLNTLLRCKIDMVDKIFSPAKPEAALEAAIDSLVNGVFHVS